MSGGQSTRRLLVALALGGTLALLSAGATLAAPPFFHNLPEGSNACRWWPAAGGPGDLGTYHARQEVGGNLALPMYMVSEPSGCMNMPGLNYPNY
jgi:hypothetical protein